jgi:hypothetical protein
MTDRGNKLNEKGQIELFVKNTEKRMKNGCDEKDLKREGKIVM